MITAARAHLLQGREDELHPQDLFVETGTSIVLQGARAAVQIAVHVLGHHLIGVQVSSCVHRLVTNGVNRLGRIP